MSDVKYPYLPEGREFKFVGIENVFMTQAARAQQIGSGDHLFPIGAVLVRDGHVIVQAGNGFNRGSEFVHVCPRVVLESPSGTGYELCDLHDSPGHAEAMLMSVAKEQGIDPAGCDVYMYGHWWCCELCWNVMIKNGIRDVYLLKNAVEVFDRERVYAQTLQTKVKSVYLVGGELEDQATCEFVCEELGCICVIAIDQERMKVCDVWIVNVSQNLIELEDLLDLAKTMQKPVILISKKDTEISDEVLKHPVVVYHIVHEEEDRTRRQLKNVLKQM